jgi:muconate cycloisomerase
MAHIDRIETIIVDLPTIRPHVLSMATLNLQTLMIIRVYSSDGIVGVGEGTTIGGLAYGDESPEGIKLAIDNYFEPIMKMCDASIPARVMAKIERHAVGNRFAKCAVETALLDAQGKRAGLPVSELIGGRLREELPVLWTLASGDSGKDVAEAQEMIDRRRHNTFKLKLGKREMSVDMAHFAAVRNGLDQGVSLRVDVNTAWTETQAHRGIAMLEALGCDLVEQPISRRNRAGMSRLVARSRIPIMADEALAGPEDAYDFAVRAAADVFSVKIEQSGGLFASKRVQAIADAAGVSLYGGTMLEAGIGTIASAHVFATFPKLEWGTELFGPLLLRDEILARPLQYENFSLKIPAGPGLGVDLDEDKIAFYRRDAARRTTSLGKES